jgi:hypothetical protein
MMVRSRFKTTLSVIISKPILALLGSFQTPKKHLKTTTTGPLFVFPIDMEQVGWIPNMVGIIMCNRTSNKYSKEQCTKEKKIPAIM